MVKKNGVLRVIREFGSQTGPKLGQVSIPWTFNNLGFASDVFPKL